MFKTKKQIKELNQKLEEIRVAKEELLKEKEELLKIKELLENTNNPDYIDISDVYTWRDGGQVSFVRLKVEEKEGRNSVLGYVKGYESTLTDIFTNKIIYKKFSIKKIERMEPIATGDTSYYAFFDPIFKEAKDLLIYVDKKVPRYVLYQHYYRLNNLDITSIPIQKHL